MKMYRGRWRWKDWRDRLGALVLFLLVGFPIYLPVGGLLYVSWDIAAEAWQRRAAGKSLAAAERTRLHPPVAFARIGADGGTFLADLSSGRGEEEEILAAQRSASGLRIEQPVRIGAGGDQGISGVAVRNIEGDFELKACLDLRASTLKAGGTSLDFSAMVDWEGVYRLDLSYEPGARTLRCGDGVLRVPRDAGLVCVWLARKRAELAASAAIGVEGVRGRLCAASVPAVRPLKQIDVSVYLPRPPGVPVGREFKAAGKDVYDLSSFSVTCLDPAGCRARAD